MEAFYQTTEPKFMTHKRPRSFYVVGADLDRDLVTTLVPGDEVLMEVNGARTYTAQPCQLVAESPWTVIENTVGVLADSKGKLTGQLVVTHPKLAQPFVLSYDHLLETGKGEPAVFAEQDSKIRDGQLFVILQLVAFRVAEDKVGDYFPALSKESRTAFVEALEDERIKLGVLEDWAKRMRVIKPDSWAYLGVKRMALRSGVYTAVINALRNLDYTALLKVSDADLLKVRQECHWLPMLLRQSDLIQHDHEREYVKHEKP